jgi:hypothetical protein
MEGPSVLPRDHKRPVECPAARIVFHHRELGRRETIYLFHRTFGAKRRRTYEGALIVSLSVV